MVSALEKINKGQFVKMLDAFLRDSFNNLSVDMFKSRQLRFSSDSDPLFEYEIDPRISVVEGGRLSIAATDPLIREDLLDSLDRVGAFDLVSDFLPCVPTKLLTSGTQDQIGLSKGTDEQEWADWFLRIVGAVEATGKHVILVPDTNFILRHYCSNILLPILGQQDFRKLRFQLPRLVIIEIEAKCNRSREGSKEKRLAFYGAKEALFLMQQFATHFPELDLNLLTGFSRMAGERFADSWIRREIHDFIKLERRGVILLTADLMNSLAATAEGLDVFYFTKKNEKIKPIRETAQLAEFIIDVAITFGNIKMDVVIGEEQKGSRLIEGMWSGKTPSDWQNDCIRTSLK